MRKAEIEVEEFLRTSEAAEFIKVSPRTLESWRAKEEEPRFVRVGKRLVRYRKSDLQDWLARQSHDMNTEGVR